MEVETGRLLQGSPIATPVPWVALVTPPGGPVVDLGTVTLEDFEPDLVLTFLRRPKLPLSFDNSDQCSADNPTQKDGHGLVTEYRTYDVICAMGGDQNGEFYPYMSQSHTHGKT